MKKILFTLISLIGCAVSAMAQCPPAATSSSNVVLTQRVAKVGMLNGEFTVNAEGKKVSFSKGNLQYQASTETWRFAENQWDAIGGYSSSSSMKGVSPLDVTSANNTTYGSRSTQIDWIDLFGWGTSGNSASGTHYLPWDCSGDRETYGNTNPTSGVWVAANSDWGVVNAGQLGDGWYTMSWPEWQYLISTRGGTNAPRYANAKVHGIGGVILFPDGWTQAKSAIAYSISNINTSSGTFASNTITDANWEELEKEGAVFLPAAGYRAGDTTSSPSVYYGGKMGYYWAATAGNSQTGYMYNFSDGSLSTDNSKERCYGISVRLVHQVYPAP